MLHNKRNVQQCEYGCCKTKVRNATLRAREARSWRKDQRDI